MTKDDVLSWAKKISESKGFIAIVGAVLGFLFAVAILGVTKGKGDEGATHGSGCLTPLFAVGVFFAVVWAVASLGLTWPVITLVGVISIVVLAVIAKR